MAMETSVKKIRKRNGDIVDFNQDKITDAIYKAAVSVGGRDRRTAEKISDGVVEALERKFDGKAIPTVEEIQDTVEKVLIEMGHARTAKSYILYRQKRAELRQVKASLGVIDDLKLSVNALKVLEARYLKKDANRQVIETPKGMMRRVAKNIALADLNYDPNANIKGTEEEFYGMLVNLEFLPNSPTLMNAGKDLQQLSACFVLPVPDSMEGIFDAIKHAALVHQSGGGTGFSFSRLRPKGDIVRSTSGVASGPVSFMKVFNAATEVIKQGGTRRGANMGILRIDHPDILEFITCKERNDQLTNFNISVGITEKFMQAVIEGGDYDLLNPHNGQSVNRLNARKVFDLVVMMSWKNGEPGIIFLDRLNRDNPTPLMGQIESTNPCGEQPLLPYEACNLGSINLVKIVTEIEGKAAIDYPKLRRTVRSAIHFLDNVIDMSKFPLDQIEKMVRGNRKIGLGVMGFADMLIMLGVPYDSEEAVSLAEEVMYFISRESKHMSAEIAKARGTFPNFGGSIYDKPGKAGMKLRNATTNTIAPTGTLSILAGCSSGVEPLFAISYIRNVMDGTEMLEVNPVFERISRERGFYSEYLMKLIAKRGTIQGIEEIPEDVRRFFVTAHDIKPEWHVRIQGAFQKYVDNAVSKTVNFSHEATTEDVEKVYLLAHELGCKGVTIYRDGSRENQVLNIEVVKKAPAKEEEKVHVVAKASGGSGSSTGSHSAKPSSSYSSDFAGGCKTCSI